jgi:hypothetical protein
MMNQNHPKVLQSAPTSRQSVSAACRCVTEHHFTHQSYSHFWAIDLQTSDLNSKRSRWRYTVDSDAALPHTVNLPTCDIPSLLNMSLNTHPVQSMMLEPRHVGSVSANYLRSQNVQLQLHFGTTNSFDH